MNKHNTLTGSNHTSWLQACNRIIISALSLLTLNACTLSTNLTHSAAGQTNQPSSPEPHSESSAINSNTHETHQPNDQHPPHELIGSLWKVDQLLPGGLMDRQYLTIVLHPNGQISGHLQQLTYTGQYKFSRTKSNHKNTDPQKNHLTPIQLFPTLTHNSKQQTEPTQTQLIHNARYLKTLQEITHFCIDKQGALRLYSADKQLRILARQ